MKKQRPIAANFKDGLPTTTVLVDVLKEFDAHGFTFFVHRETEGSRLVCSEASTGWQACYQQPTKQTIKAFAAYAYDKMLGTPEATLHKVVNHALNENRISGIGQITTA